MFISVHEMKTSVYFQKPLKVLILKGLMVGLGGLEPPTSPLSGVRSNQAELQTHKNGNVHSTFRIQFGQLFFKDF